VKKLAVIFSINIVISALLTSPISAAQPDAEKIKEELTYTISVQAYLYGYTTMDLYRIFATADGAAVPKQEQQAL